MRQCICKDCGEAWFAPLRKKGGPYRTRCVACHSAVRKEVYKNNNRRRYASLQRFLKAVKETSGCVDCGYSTHLAALQFDHTGVKNFKLACAVTISRAVPELMTCDVRCANCHAIKTWERTQ